MNIIGPDALVFGVDDVAACGSYLTAFGLEPVGADAEAAASRRSTARSIVIRHARRSRPARRRWRSGNMLRQIVYGVADEAAVRSSPPNSRATGRCGALADGARRGDRRSGFALRFQVTVRRPLDLPGERVNAPGIAAAARRQSDRRPARHAGQAAHALACRLLRARHRRGRGLLRQIASASRSPTGWATPARSCARPARRITTRSSSSRRRRT